MKYFLIKLCFIILPLFFLLACHFLETKKIEPQKSSQAMVTLGQLFFFDTRLSANNTKSCATCHDPQFAFTDGYRKSMGIYADETQRNAPTLLNSRFLSSLTYADPNIKNYYQQMQKPLFSQHPPELGLNKSDINVLNRFRNDSMYKAIFKKAFSIKNIQDIDYEDIMLAISAYEKQLVSFGSRYDEYLSDRKHKTLTFSELKGEQFFLKNCSHCHVVYSKEKSILNNNVENNYSVSDVVDMSDLGLYETTKIEADKHKFRVPTLRNIALTAPYFHNGSVEKLEIAMLHSKPTIDAVEKKALLLFLNTLTDSTIFTNPLFRKLQIIEKTIAPSQPSPRGKE